MKLLRTGLTAVALLASVCGVAQAAPLFATGTSSIFFNNFENLYRSTSACTPGQCLAAVAGDPAGFRRVNTNVIGNVQVKDIFIGILNVQNVVSATSGTDTYNSNPGTRFTGYFVQEVASFGVAEAGTGLAHLNLGTVADPFGILQTGEMFRFYSDTSAFSSGGSTSNITANVSLATSGTFWGSLGLGTEGYSYTHTDLSVAGGNPATDSNTENFSALDLILAGPGYSAGMLSLINNFNETEVGGTIAAAASQLCSAAEAALSGPGTPTCNNFVGTSEIEANNFFGVSSPWQFASNDPYELNRIPEPGSLALMGLALAGLGFARRRRSI